MDTGQMGIDREAAAREIEVVEEELTDQLAMVWLAYYMGESGEVQQRLVNNAARFLYAELNPYLIAQAVFHKLWNEAERRGQEMLAQVPVGQEGDPVGYVPPMPSGDEPGR